MCPETWSFPAGFKSLRPKSLNKFGQIVTARGDRRPARRPRHQLGARLRRFRRRWRRENFSGGGSIFVRDLDANSADGPRKVWRIFDRELIRDEGGDAAAFERGAHDLSFCEE